MTHIVKNKIHFDSNSVPERLFALRKEKLRMDQRAFAAMVGISQSVLSKWERGVYAPPALALMKIGDISSGDRMWWYEQAGPEHAKRLREETGQSNAVELGPIHVSPWDPELMSIVIEAMNRRYGMEGDLEDKEYAKKVIFFYELCHKMKTEDPAMVEQFLKSA